MNVDELKITLDKEGVNPLYYSLDGSTKRAWMGAWILENRKDVWLVYFSERGMKFELTKLSIEDEASQYILKRLLQSPTTRIFMPKKRGFRAWFNKYRPF